MDEGRFTPSLDRYARMVMRQLRTPTGLVSVVRSEDQKQVFPGAAGDFVAERETPISHSFCKYVVADDAPLIIRDARSHPRTWDNPAIGDYDVIAYAGFPLRDRTGKPIGSVCAIDTVPRDWTDEEIAALRDVAEATNAEVARRELTWRMEVAWTIVAAAVLIALASLLLLLT